MGFSGTSFILWFNEEKEKKTNMSLDEEL